jgi:hypothetical protein
VVAVSVPTLSSDEGEQAVNAQLSSAAAGSSLRIGMTSIDSIGCLPLRTRGIRRGYYQQPAALRHSASLKKPREQAHSRQAGLILLGSEK